MTNKSKIITTVAITALVLGAMGTMLGFAIKGGKSAYDIAVENGFTGTQEEWLASLKGANGTDGQPGVAGQDGQPGAAGETGPQGPQGEVGPQGETGASGKSAYEIAVDKGFTGNQDEWLESLKAPRESTRISTFGEIYNRITEDVDIDYTRFDLDVAANSDNFYPTFILENSFDYEEIYENLGGTHFELEGTFIQSRKRNIDDNHLDVQEMLYESYTYDLKCINVEFGEESDVCALFTFETSQDEYCKKVEANELVDDNHSFSHKDNFEFERIGNDYYVFMGCERIQDDVLTNEGIDSWYSYYKFESKDKYMQTLASIAFVTEFAAKNGTIYELLMDYDFDAHFTMFDESYVGFIPKEDVESMLLRADALYDYEEQTYDLVARLKPNPELDFNIGISHLEKENEESTIFMATGTITNLLSKDVNKSYMLIRQGSYSKNENLTFERTTEIKEDRYTLEACLDHFLNNPNLAPYFTLGAIEDNLYNGLFISDFALDTANFLE